MNILVTGANGFVGKNLVWALQNIADGKRKSRYLSENITVFSYDIDTPEEKLCEYCSKCDFVYHLAGVNRPEKEEDFMKGNFGFTSVLLDTLKKYNNKAPIVVTSSIQAALDNPYGRSKKAGENLLFEYAKETQAKVMIYRLPNLFGKWCRPNYNSVIATFCHNIANDLEITVNDREYVLTLAYIDDVVEEFLKAAAGKESYDDTHTFCDVTVKHKASLGEIADLLYEFKESRNNRYIPDMPEGSFEKKLYSTYLSYLRIDDFLYPLKMNCDERGSFTEMFKSKTNGQVSVNISKPGIVKGNHWHDTKNEKFVVVSGKGVIRFKKAGEEEIVEYYVSGDKIEVVDIPVGYTHNIENLGDEDMVTIMWCNECFDPDKPDTYFLEV